MKVVRRDGQIMEGRFEDEEVRKAFWHTSAHELPRRDACIQDGAKVIQRTSHAPGRIGACTQA